MVQILEILTQPLFSSTTTKHYRVHKKNERAVEVFDLSGTLIVRGERYEIDGHEFWLSPDTWIVGKPLNGCSAKVKGTFDDGIPIATCLVIN